MTAQEHVQEITMACSLQFQSIHGNNIALAKNFNSWCTDNHIHVHFAIYVT